MPETGGSFGGGDITLTLQFAGLPAVPETLEALLREVEAAKAGMNQAELEAAATLRAYAERVAGQVQQAAEVAGGAKQVAVQQEQVYTRLFQDYRSLGGSMGDLRRVLSDLRGGAAADPDAEEEKPRRGGAPPGSKLKKAVGNFVNVGRQAAGAVGGLMRNITGAFPMGVGGFIGLMLYGVAYEDKIRTETERYRQMWTSATDATSAAGFTVAQRHAARLSQQIVALTETFRMTKEEAAATMTSFVSTGVGIEEVSRRTNITIGGARASVFMANAGIDQFFRLQQGFAGQTTAKIIHEYGLSAEDATQQVLSLALAGRESGVGIQNFMNDVMKATGQMRQYGASVEDTMAIASSLQSSLERANMTPHFAGALSILATGQIASGLAGMSKGMQMLIAEKMGLGQDRAAYYALRDAMMDPQQGPGAFKDMTLAMVDLMKTGRRQTKAELAYMIENMLPQIDAGSSKMLVESVEILRRTDVTKSERVQADKSINAAFARERARTEDWRVGFKDLMRGMSKIGLAFFNLMTGGLAEIVLGMQMLPIAFMEFIGNLAKKLGVTKIVNAMPGMRGVLETLAGGAGVAQRVPTGPSLAWLSLAAKGALQGGLSGEEKDRQAVLKAQFGKALAFNEKAIKLLGQGFEETGSAAKKMFGTDIMDISPGVQALVSSFGTPEGVSRAARGADTDAIEAMVSRGAPHLRRVAEGGERIRGVEIEASDVLSMQRAARGGDFGAVQAGLASAVEDYADRFGEDVDEDDVIITDVDFGEVRPDGTATVSIYYSYTSAVSAEAAIQAAGTRVRRGAPTLTAEERSAAVERALVRPASQAGLVSRFPVAGAVTRNNEAAFRTIIGGSSESPVVHGAADIHAAGGTPIVAPVTGRVVTAVKNPKQSHVAILDPATQRLHKLMHLADLKVSQGQMIRAGQPLGVLSKYAYRGTSATDPHLHYEIWDKPDQQGHRKRIHFYDALKAAH